LLKPIKLKPIKLKTLKPLKPVKPPKPLKLRRSIRPPDSGRGSGRYRVALAQMTPILGDVRANVGRAAVLAAEASRAGARLVVFPELALTGYFLKDLVGEVARPLDAPEFEPLASLSAHIGIVAGFVEAGADATLYNAAALWLGGRPAWVHRKLYLPTYGVFDEGRYVARGRRLEAFDSPFGRSGLLICEDIWHPSTVYVLAQDGTQLLIVVSASPTREVGGEAASRVGSIWYDLLRVHAVMQGLHIVFVNRVGFEDGVNFWGGSRIVGPDGSVRAEAPLFDESLTIGEVDPLEVMRERTRSHHVWDEDPHLTLRCLRAALARRARDGGAQDRNRKRDQENQEPQDAQSQRRKTGRAPARAGRRPGHAR
jgi:predicted amidohydrolase